jgi:hypothetical protein
LSASSVNIAVSAVRFLYAVTLGRETLDLMASVPHMKRATRRAEVYARSEVEAILTAPRQPRDRVLLMTVYGCGLRISEANMSGNTVILGLALAQLESGSVTMTLFALWGFCFGAALAGRIVKTFRSGTVLSFMFQFPLLLVLQLLGNEKKLIVTNEVGLALLSGGFSGL